MIKEIAAYLGFNYTLRQSQDGQIGTVERMNGVYGELTKQVCLFDKLQLATVEHNL